MQIARGVMVMAALTLTTAAFAEVKTREVEYKQGDTVLKGFIAWDDAVPDQRPGVLVVHEWWGHNEHARNQAKRLAEAGYVGFALDMYGEGKSTTHPADAEGFMKEATQDPMVVAARFNAAREQLEQDPHVNPKQIAAIGYCFGGGVVLGMARSGADLDAVVSFHGALEAQSPAQEGKVAARVLVLAGGADPFVPPQQVKALEQEMKSARAKFQIITYPGAKHGFTNPSAAQYGMDALAYDAEADKKSWAAMLKLFDKVF